MTTTEKAQPKYKAVENYVVRDDGYAAAFFSNLSAQAVVKSLTLGEYDGSSFSWSTPEEYARDIQRSNP